MRCSSRFSCVPLLTAFGATPDVMPYAETYSRIVALGMPFLIVTNGMSNLARADGSPKYSMVCMLIGAVVNTILDPVFIFIFHLGVAGAAWGDHYRSVLLIYICVLYIRKFKNIRLTRKGSRTFGK